MNELTKYVLYFVLGGTLVSVSTEYKIEHVFCQWLRIEPSQSFSVRSILAVFTSALVFACDPFMVMTFQHLHWIAVWDGLIWGWLYVRSHNLYTVIVAHAVEVVILYSCIKAALM